MVQSNFQSVCDYKAKRIRINTNMIDNNASNQNKHQYDRKPLSVHLQPNDRVYVCNVSQRGRWGKLCAYWEKRIPILVKRKDGFSTSKIRAFCLLFLFPGRVKKMQLVFNGPFLHVKVVVLIFQQHYFYQVGQYSTKKK